MVTGALDPRKALMLSTLLIIGAALVTWFFLEPAAVVFLLAGVALNVLYEKAKGFGAWGNLVFGLMISMATLYGFAAMGAHENVSGTFPHPARTRPALYDQRNHDLVHLFQGLPGRCGPGKRTLIVIWGLKKSRVLAFAAAFLPVLLFAVLKATNRLPIAVGASSFFSDRWP